MQSDTLSVAALIFYRRLAESDVIVTPSVTCMDWICWWYNHTPHLVSSQQHWLFLPAWGINVNIHHLVQSKWKNQLKTKGT